MHVGGDTKLHFATWFLSVSRTLAGSTIMLLTLPWLGGLILGRVDIVNGVGRDNKCSPFTLKSFFNQVGFMCELTVISYCETSVWT